jgi:RNA polymerase sigma-70 factor (ECF subfamily)
VRRISDEELMLRVREGDLHCFESIVERYKAVVYSLAHSMLRSREDAEEAAQDSFLKLFRARSTYDPTRALEPWLLRIAGNTCRDLLRRRRVASLPVARDAEGEPMAHLVEDTRIVEVETRESVQQAVRREMAQLSDKFRTPLMLKYVYGFTNQQIAESMGISVSNVKVRLGRAKDLLQSRLERAMESER